MAISVIKNTERWMKAKNKWNYSPALILESEGDYVDNSFPNPNIKVMIKEISRRPNYVAVIKYMLSCSEPQYVSEIQKNTGINPVTLTCILKKLFYHGVINYIDQKTDRNKTYFILNDSILANKIILRFHYLLGFKFAKLVPFDEAMYESDLVEDKKFKEMCKKYGVSTEEAFDTLENCTREIEVSKSSYSNERRFERKTFTGEK